MGINSKTEGSAVTSSAKRIALVGSLTTGTLRVEGTLGSITELIVLNPRVLGM
jgi:hypothetical protein